MQYIEYFFGSKRNEADFHYLLFITSEMKSEASQNSPKAFKIFRTLTLIFPSCLSTFSNIHRKTGDERGEANNDFFFVGEC